MTAATPIDLDFRPRTYFWPLGFEKKLLARVKGVERRALLKRLLDEGRLDDIPEFLAKVQLTEQERTSIGRIHPRLMGGEYLPDQLAGEVEIARIVLESTMCDVTCVYARRDGAGLRYRVVDEYNGNTLTGRTETVSLQPLTLGELLDFYLRGWRLFDLLYDNFGYDVTGMLAFFSARSEFYPDFDRLLREQLVKAMTPEEDEEEA